jgi:hypothetical protein
MNLKNYWFLFISFLLLLAIEYKAKALSVRCFKVLACSILAC